MKMYITNKSDSQPFSVDLEDSSGGMIRPLVPPLETRCFTGIDPLYINQDEIFRREVLFPAQPGGWLIVWFECEDTDLVALNTKICVPRGGATCGQLLVADGNGTFRAVGPGADGDVLLWDSTAPSCVKFGPAATALTIEDDGTPIGNKTILNFAGAGVTAANVGGGRATITIPGGGGISGINAEDEGIAVVGGPFTTINIVGPGVIATDGGGGVLNVTHAAGAFDVDAVLVNCDCQTMCNCDGNLMVVC